MSNVCLDQQRHSGRNPWVEDWASAYVSKLGKLPQSLTRANATGGSFRRSGFPHVRAQQLVAAA